MNFRNFRNFRKSRVLNNIKERLGKASKNRPIEEDYVGN